MLQKVILSYQSFRVTDSCPILLIWERYHRLQTLSSSEYWLPAHACGRGYAPSITSDRTSAWHATFGEESGKSVARWSSLWVDICVARCVKQCQIRRNQSKRSLIDYLTMLSGSKAAFRTNYLHERSFTLREVLKKSKCKFKMAFAMKGGGGLSRGSQLPHIHFEKWFLLKTI